MAEPAVKRWYRLFRRKFQPWDSTGARLFGGRWNAPGTDVLYASESLALACLEILVHIERPALPVDYAWVAIDVPEHTTKALTEADAAIDNEHWCRAAGQQWVSSEAYAALVVPSVIVRIERNLLLNPKHPAFRQIKFSAPEAFWIDPRLLPGRTVR